MKGFKSIRRALICSVLSLILCVSTLVGTTLAYYTDAARSSNHLISSGSLSVKLDYAKKDGTGLTEWQSVEGSSSLFDPNALWEPGRVEVVYLRVSNVGDLALKYQLFMNVFSETLGETYLGDPLRLSDYLRFEVLETDGSVISDDEAIRRVKASSMALKNYNGATRLLGKGETAYVVMIVYLPSELGDTVNNYGPSNPRVELGINLRATQVDFESDIFGPDYDKDILFGATYVEDLEDLRESVDADDEVLISKDIGVTDDDHLINAGTPEDEFFTGILVKTDTELHLSKNHLRYLGTREIDSLLHVTDGARLDLVGGFKNLVYSTGTIRRALITADKGSVINIHGGDFSVPEGTLLYADTGAVINVYNGFFGVHENPTLLEGEGGASVFSLRSTPAPLFVATGVDGAKICLYGGTYINFDPRTVDGGSMIAEGYRVIESTQESGDVYYTVVPEICETYTPVTDIESIKNAFSSSAEGIYLSTDIDCEPNTESMMYGKKGETLNINGGGTTITTNGTGTKAGTSSDYGYVAFIPALGEDATLSDLRVTGSGFVEVGDYETGLSTGTFTVSNLVIENLVATLHINNGGNNIAPTFSHYSKTNCYLIDCTMTGVTTEKNGYKPYDAALINGTKTVIERGKYGSIYVANQAYVTIRGAEVDSIDSCAIVYKTTTKGRLTVESGSKVGTITMNSGAYEPSITIRSGAQVGKLIFNDETTKYIVIEEGAIIDRLIYQGVSYTLEEWRARS